MAGYALDTNVLIDALNQPARLEDLLAFLSCALPQIHLSAVVAHELDAGTTAARQRGLLDRHLVGPFERRGRVFAPSVAAWRRAGQLLALGHRAPSAARLNDLLLAVSCREAGLTLVTRDRDFRRLARLIRGLRVMAPFPIKTSPGSS